ncbi:MAG: asparagine synthetase B, partial [Bryobacterales bacterium]|nr:asparagine synthetase B [Bryobacterales bacterium]
MCGIAGFVAARQAVDDPKSLLATMVKALGHRGPDGAGVHLDDGAGLGHTRLAILDIAGGYQPMSNEDGSLWITFNGEIFNHVELRQELLGKGHVLSTRSDTEVILHLFEQEGEDCVRRLNGQWAFAIWNQHTRTAFLSRDRFGVRPLFYTSGEGLFLFASEIKAILAAPGVSRRPDLAALDQILTYWCTLPPRTMFEGIWELPPGCSATVKDGEVRVRRHWRLQYAGDGGYGKTPE